MVVRDLEIDEPFPVATQTTKQTMTIASPPSTQFTKQRDQVPLEKLYTEADKEIHLAHLPLNLHTKDSSPCGPGGEQRFGDTRFACRHIKDCF